LFLESKLIREPSRLRLPEFCAASMHRSSRVRKALEILNAADPPPQPLSKPAGDENTCREVQGVFLGAEWNAICRWLCGASTIDERKLCSGRAAMKSALPGLAILILLPMASTAAARPQQDGSTSIADAARRSRELKKDQPKSTKVWDNDTIPTKPGYVSVIGQAPAAQTSDDSAASASGESSNASANSTAQAASSDASSAASSASAPAAAASEGSKVAQEIAGIQTDLAAAKTHLQSAKADLDILQRTYTLDSQMYYSKPNYSADRDGAAKLAGEKSEIDAKQQEVADAQMKVDQLEAKLAAVR